MGDNAVPDFSSQHWLRRTILADVPSLRGCEDVAKPLVGNGGVLVVEELVGDGSNDEGETGDMGIMVTKRERVKGQRYALAIEGDEDACKVVEGDGEWSWVELTS